MDYQGPTAEDLRNIRALNMAFLRATNCSDCALQNGIASQPLTEMQIRRLGEAPFLLFSFREQDGEFWKRVLTGDSQQDLLHPAVQPGGRLHELQVAGLGFVWQLSRRNPYVSRVVSGAPVGWCERLAGSTLARLLERAAMRSDLLCARFTGDDTIWRRLLNGGVNSKHSLRRTSHHCALQALLTGEHQTRKIRIPAAACSMKHPLQRDAFPTASGVRHSKV